MFFSENKLRKLINLNNKISSNQICEAINSIGFEVEKIEKFSNNKNLKFGHILSTSKNPNSEKLTVCEVEFNDKKRIIQTAATNVKKDDYVIAAIPGSIINGIEIKSKEMAKIISEGMLCSLGELGFKESLLTSELIDNIFILDNEIDLNLDPISYFNLDDNIIEISILSNRSDAQSYLILANELAAYFHLKPNNELFETKKTTFVSNIKIEQNEINKLNGAEVEVDNNFKLPIDDLFLLLKSNIKIEHNEFINFANLLMIITGVSSRVFDKNKIGNKLKINSNEKIIYLNDGKNNISVLGVEEIKDYQSTNQSKKILFEFSQVDEKIVRDNSKLIKKITNSSINNSRVISDGLINATRNLIAKYFKNTSKLINEIKIKSNKIKFDKEYLNNYAGFDITKNSKYKHAIKSLEILGFKFDTYISYPNTRHDIKNMQNIVEEIFRFYGLNNFEPQQNETKTTIISSIDQLEKSISFLGYTQVWTYTLMNKDKNKFNPFEFRDVKNLKTFVSEEYNSIRNSIAIPLLNVYEYNFKRKINKLSLFDRGMINDKKSIIISSNEKSFKQIKSDIEKISNQKFTIYPLANEYLHSNYNAGLYLGSNLVGWIGKFNPYKIDSDVIFAEILEECIYNVSNKFIEFDSEPLKERDITFEIKNDYEHQLYLNKLNSLDGVYSISLLSTFEKNGLIRISYKILMNEKALNVFDSVDWTNINEIF